MPRRSKFTPKKTDKGWEINVPEKFTASGKRERHYHPSRELALAESRSLRERQEMFGVNAIAITPTLASQAVQAKAILDPLGIDLIDAVRRFVETETRERASVSVADALAAFRAGKAGLSDKQSQAYRLRAEKLIAEFGDRLISTIDGEELQDHLEATTGGDAAFNQNFRLLRAIWTWCAKPPRKWCNDEPIRHLETKDSESGEIGILAVKQAEAVLRSAEKHYPETVPAFAIGLFTGLRAAEIGRLKPEDITHEGINVPKSNDRKNKRRRFIQMNTPLAVWLKAYPIEDRVIPAGWSRKQRAVRRIAGFKVWTDLIEPNQPPENLSKWPANAIRHTAATVAVVLGKPIEQLTFEHGHSGGLETLKRHYVGAMPKSDAEKIWALRPKP